MNEVIQSAAELDALPPGVIVRSAAGTIACRHDGGMGVCFGVERPFEWDRLALPLTVLYRPDRPAQPDVASIVRFLVEGRREYQRDNGDEYLAGQVNGADRILTILTADSESDGWKVAVEGWLPSWRWAGFAELWQQAHRRRSA